MYNVSENVQVWNESKREISYFGKHEPDEIISTEDISDNTVRKHKTIAQDIKEVGPHEGGNHGTKVQSIRKRHR